ncbi:MAG TPA: S8 family serine peptidase, partial [Allosphingosinicella sp.]|nr:S8 family serine peptidase [Allosphingosinicella sp.]
MPISLPPKIIDALLLGVGGRRRELQDFPVLGDVWARFAEEPGKEHDLLINPTWEKPTGEVAKLVARTGLADEEEGPYNRKVAYLQGLVVASLTLEDLAGVAIPATKWWDGICDEWDQNVPGGRTSDAPAYPSDRQLRLWIRLELRSALRDENMAGRLTNGQAFRCYDRMPTTDRQAAKLGLLLGVLRAAAAKSAEPAGAGSLDTLAAAVEKLGRGAIVAEGSKTLRLIIARHRGFANAHGDCPWNGLIFQVSLNREAEPAVTQSVSAIKADAARSLFSISCKEIGWAVLDSGIDQAHPAFWDYPKIFRDQERAATDVEKGKAPDPPQNPRPHRVKATFDFRRIRAIMSVDAIDHDKLVGEIDPQSSLEASAIRDTLKELADDRKQGKRVNWAKVRPLIEQVNPESPPHPHGTHVAGIIGAHWLDFKRNQEPKRSDSVRMDGVCPDIALYDFRVLGSSLGDSEFAVIAALQFIRFLNDQSGYSVIDGINMSLSIPHNVRNYACGRTQVCVEAESLASNGVVVVAAAGNRGFQQYRLADNSLFESYAASSITDP